MCTKQSLNKEAFKGEIKYNKKLKNKHPKRQSLKKIFLIQEENKNSDRLVESIKHEIRKYLKRERAKKTPEGFHFWDFDCKFGQNSETAHVIHHADFTAEIDKAHAEKWSECYVEIIAKPAKKPVAPAKVEETK